MSSSSHSITKYKFLFLVGVTAIYLALVAYLDFLQGAYWWDEKQFWTTSLSFSHQLVPSLDQLRDYKELNTPLPFIIFGVIEYIFHQGIFAGRLFNLVLSISMVFVIGWPGKGKGGRALLCLVGLLMCPYYLWLSGRLYTEMIACSWMIVGFIGYVRNRYILSSIAFILAIASRQYMLAFPAAIVSYEFIVAVAHAVRLRRFHLADHWKWLSPLLAVLSILFWIYLFKGLTPQSALESRPAPEVQQSFWALTPGGAVNFLASVGFYIVIPEFILFSDFRKILRQRDIGHLFSSYLKTRVLGITSHWRRLLTIAVLLLLFILIFPPLLYGAGNLIKIAYLLPSDIWKFGLFYGLAYIACVRFAHPDLIACMVFFNSLIMMKAFPWDRYVLPLVVAFWYLKSIDFRGDLSPAGRTEHGLSEG